MKKKSPADVIQTFIITDRMHRTMFEKEMAALGIHRSQHRILMYLAKKSPEAPSQKEIAETFRISPAAVAVTLKKLEAGGYIVKTALEKDNRVNTVSVTDKALDVVNQTVEISKKLEKCLFENFTQDEIDFFCRCLEKMQNSMKTYSERAEMTEGEKHL